MNLQFSLLIRSQDLEAWYDLVVMCVDPQPHD